MLRCLQDCLQNSPQRNREEKHWSICYVKSVLHPKRRFTAMSQRHPLRGALTNDCAFLTPDEYCLAWFLVVMDESKQQMWKRNHLRVGAFFSQNVFCVSAPSGTAKFSQLLTNPSIQLPIRNSNRFSAMLFVRFQNCIQQHFSVMTIECYELLYIMLTFSKWKNEMFL